MTGVLPSQTLRDMLAGHQISADFPVTEDQIQPASIDLRLGSHAWRVRASFLPGQGVSVSDRLSDFAMHSFDLDGGAVLETGCVYVVPLQEALSLPPDVSAVANAKSSTGRLDLFTRLIADDGTEFDRVPAGYSGPLYAEVSPRSFSVLIRPGVRLNQIRFRQGKVELDDEALRKLHNEVGLVNHDAPHIDNGLGFSVDLDLGAEQPVGYRARAHAGLIDLERINHYRIADFWEPVHARADKVIVLEPGAFYILISREAVHVPPGYAAEMAPYLAMVGEFRVHYAGFFDPGFGHAPAGGGGSRGVLEVRCHEAPFALSHGQIVGRLVYETMSQEPDVLYGAGLSSNYQGQGLKLSKHFRSDG